MTDIHKDFADWYSRVDLGESPDRLATRWEAVSSLIESADYDTYENLVDIFLERPNVVSGAAGEAVRTAINALDQTFPKSGNDAELRLLAEVIIAVKIGSEERSELVGQVAGLIFTALGGGTVEVDSVTGLFDRARHAMCIQGTAIRQRDTLPKTPKSHAPVIDFSDCIEDGEDMSSIPTARAVMAKMGSKISSAIGNSASRARRERLSLQKQLAVQDEELDMLWWASNGISKASGEAIKSLPDGVRGLRAAKEAADLTPFEPGPAAIDGLLEKAGVSAKKKISIGDAINACDEAWLRSIQAEAASAQTPIHFAIAKRLETSDTDTWSAHWGAITGIDASKKLPELEISHLFYRERLVLNAFGDG